MLILIHDNIADSFSETFLSVSTELSVFGEFFNREVDAGWGFVGESFVDEFLGGEDLFANVLGGFGANVWFD